MRESVAADVKLARHTYGCRIKIPIKHIHGSVRDRITDRNRAVDARQIVNPKAGRKGRVLCRAITVDEPAALQLFANLPHVWHGQDVAACQQLPETAQIFEMVIDHQMK